MTYENYDIFNSVVVLNGGDVGKKCRVLAVRFQQHIFNILVSGRALLAKYMEYSIIEVVAQNLELSSLKYLQFCFSI